MLDNQAVKGERARLFPVIADTSREGRVLSISLACMATVFEFRKKLFASLGQSVGLRTKIDAYTEVTFPQDEDRKTRPDGLVVLRTANRTWSALIEAKVGNAEIDPVQIERYMKLSKRNGIDAVISISNQFATHADQPPYAVSRTGAKGIGLYHWSWMHLRTEASVLCDNEAIDDTDQIFILEEFVRYLSHPSVGVSGFDQMSAGWSEIVSLVQKGGRLLKSSTETREAVDAWHQELRDLALILRRRTASAVTLRLPRAHTADPKLRTKADIDSLCDEFCLNAAFDIPDAAAPLDVAVNIQSRAISVGMKLRAPEDKKSGMARLNWMLRQLKNVDPDRVNIRLHWPGKMPFTQATLSTVLEDPDCLLPDDGKKAPHSIEVLLATDDGRRFRGRKTFIELLENTVPEFYDRIGQHLKAWEKPAPRMQKVEPERDLEDVDLPTRSDANKENVE